MKRSKALSLVLMGSLTLGTAGCGTDRVEEGMYTFTSLSDCTASALFTEAECRELAGNALAQTPRFGTLQDCEAQFGEGACAQPAAAGGRPAASAESGQPGAPGGTVVQQQSGGSWMPMMLGFMAGRFLGGGGMMQNSQGLYRDPAANPQQGRSFRTAGGETVKADPKGKVTNPNSRLTQSMSHNAKPAKGRSIAGSRGGFSGGSAFGGGAS